MPAIDLVSASTTGSTGNGASVLDDASGTSQTSDSQVLSADGRFVVFTSSASNLVAGDTNGATDVFVRDLSTGTTQLVSVGNSGAQGDAGSFDASISADGRYVAFASSADNLVSGDTNGVSDVFVRDLVNHTTTLVSVGQGPTPVQGNGASFDPSISADGTKVAFTSDASNLSSTPFQPGTIGLSNVFVRDLTHQTNLLVSTDWTGAIASDSISSHPVISADGSAVAFVSNADDMTKPAALGGPTPAFGQNVYVVRISPFPGFPELISVNDSGTGSGNSDSFAPTISADGRYVAFASTASDLVLLDPPPPPFPGENIYLRDTLFFVETTTRVSNATDGRVPDFDARNPSISADGRFVVFESDADNLVTGDPGDAIEKLYLTDLSTGTTTLVSTPTTGPSNSDVSDPVISGDGRVVAFMSAANDFGFTDSNNALDVFAVTLPVANDAPVATTPVAHYAATEQTNLSLKNSGMSVSDADANGASETVTLSASEGILTLVAGTSGAVIDSGNGTGSVTFHGTIGELNALLNTDGTSSVSYVDNNDNPATNALLTLSIDDDGNTGTGGPLTASATSTVDITAVNDAPVALIVMNPYHVAPNTALDLKHSGMSVSDVDGNNGAETVILSVTEGTLTLAAGTSGAVIDSGNGTGSVTFHGTIAQLDALLNTDGTSAVSYIDTSAYPAASVQLSLSINDGGHTGTGGPLTDTATVGIAILGGGHAPGAFDFNFDNNGNGHADLLLQNGTSGAVSVWESGLPSGNSLVASSVPGWHLDGIGDFDGNGKADILWESDSGSVAIWDNGVSGHTIATGMPSSWHLVGTGDFDGNGKSDILWQNDSGAVAIWDNGQSGHTVAGPGSMLPANERVVATGDFDGNGKTDILWQNTSNGALTIWNNGQPAGASTIATSMPSSWHVAGVGDFDGNGKSDILWQNDNGSVAIWDNGQIGHTIATGMPSSWHVAGVGDFDGNGKSDIVWHNDTGAVAIWDNGQIGHTVAGPGAVVPDWHIIA